VALVGGATATPSPNVLDWLARRRCHLVPDNDEVGHGLMCRTAEGLLERGAAPWWVAPAPDAAANDDLVDWLAAGGTAEDWAERLAAATPAYLQVAEAAKASGAPASQQNATVLALQAQLDQAHARIDELEGMQPRVFVQRFMREYAACVGDGSTRAVPAVALKLWLDQTAPPHTGARPPDPRGTLWKADDFKDELGSPKTQRDVLARLEGGEVAVSTYEELGSPRDGDYRRLRWVRAVDLPADPVEWLARTRRAAHKDQPVRARAKRSVPCDACLTAQCECGGAQIKTVAHRCKGCGAQTVAPHDHAPQRGSTRPVPAVLFMRPAGAPLANNGNLDRATYVENDGQNSRHLPTPLTPRADAVETALDRLTALEPLTRGWSPDAVRYFKLGAMHALAAPGALPLAAGGAE
jgi:hypothetical protein